MATSTAHDHAGVCVLCSVELKDASRGRNVRQRLDDGGTALGLGAAGVGAGVAGGGDDDGDDDLDYGGGDDGSPGGGDEDRGEDDDGCGAPGGLSSRRRALCSGGRHGTAGFYPPQRSAAGEGGNVHKEHKGHAASAPHARHAATAHFSRRPTRPRGTCANRGRTRARPSGSRRR